LLSVSSIFLMQDDKIIPEIEYLKEIRIGYCPTMINYVKDFESKNFAKSINYGSAAQAINALRKREVDAIIVGRLATQNELNEPFNYKFREGLTLVGETKKFIDIQDLKNLEIHTAINKNIVDEFLPDSTNIVFYDNLDEAINQGLSKSVLIDWNDYEDYMGLIIPMQYSQKVEKFRLPVFYTFNETIFENFKK